MYLFQDHVMIFDHGETGIYLLCFSVTLMNVINVMTIMKIWLIDL